MSGKFVTLLLFVIGRTLNNAEGRQHHPCYRICTMNTPPMTCYYNWTLLEFRTMSKACYNCPYNVTDCYRQDCIAADGTEKMVSTISKQIPGPPIEVCFNDTIVVDVTNRLPGMGTMVHWHGIRQIKTPYMDGAPMVTQCPIAQYDTFRYIFTPEDYGTFWYHSHTSCQRDGVYGSLIVRLPKQLDPHRCLYDKDHHVVLIQDWFNTSCEEKINRVNFAAGNVLVNTLLINGRGRQIRFKANNGSTIYTPLSRFVVKKGYRYRFRVIYNGNLDCPVEVSVDKHRLIMISSDSRDFQPVKAASFVINSGEKWDFVLHAKASVGLYWMKFRGLTFCNRPAQGIQAFQLAVLQYEGASGTDLPKGEVTYETAIVDGVQVNGLNKIPGDKGSISLPELKSLEPWDMSLKKTPDLRFWISDDVYQIDNPLYHVRGLYGFYQVPPSKRNISPQFNHIAMTFPPSPFLPGRYKLDSRKWCNATTLAGKDCVHNFCECPHVIQACLHCVVEIIFVDQGSFDINETHPFHLHGNFFRVVAKERGKVNFTIAEAKKLDKEGKIRRNLVDAPKKETVSSVGGGIVVIRLLADNPGYWLLHCHVEIHFEEGMGLVLKVGENDQMVPTPRGFPMCGNYKPPY